MGLSLRGTTSGAIDINPPAVAGDNAITLPASNGSANQFFKNSDTAGTITYSSMVEKSDKIGIGTVNPDTILSINGSTSTQKLITLSSGSVKRNNYIGVNNSDNLEIGTDEDNEGNNSSIRFRVDGSEKVRITSDGNVGIGTTAPQKLFHAYGTASGVEALAAIESSAQNDGILQISGPGFFSGASVDHLDLGQTTNGATVVADSTGSGSNSLIFKTTLAGITEEKLRIGTNGQIGLGNTAYYGRAGKVLMSQGDTNPAAWKSIYPFVFYGAQDTHHAINSATYTRIKNLGSRPINISPSAVAEWNESVGTLTIGADGGGYWYLSMGAGIDDISNGYMQVVIAKNGGTTSVGTVISQYSRDINTISNYIVDANVSTIVYLEPDDVVAGYIYWSSGSDGSPQNTEQNRCFFMGYKMNV